MNKTFFTCILCVLVSISTYSEPSTTEFIPQNTKRILFLGNSISYAGQFIEYFDTYYTLKHRKLQYEIINLGLPSENLSGLTEKGHARGAFGRPNLFDRLNRALEETNPDLVIANYGMNDGLIQPFKMETFQTYASGMEKLHQQVTERGIEIIHITPPIYDTQQGNSYYSNVLDIFSDWLLSKQHTDKWTIVDLHRPMQAALDNLRKTKPKFTFAKDAIHPNAFGHKLMAEIILSAFENTPIKLDKFIKNQQNGTKIHQLVTKKHRILKDAWLTKVGHDRPRMSKGIPFEEAQNAAQKLNKNIESLLKE